MANITKLEDYIKTKVIAPIKKLNKYEDSIKINAQNVDVEIEKIPASYDTELSLLEIVTTTGKPKPWVGGVKFTSSDPAGTKLLSNEGLKSKVGTSLSDPTAADNPYDNISLFTWPEVTHDNGNVMLKIPKGYVKVVDKGVDDISYFVSDVQADPDYHVHPCFIAEDGTELDYIEIGKYATNTSWRSNTGAVLHTKKRSEFRAQAAEIGAGWQQFDYYVMDYLRILWMIEFGTRSTDIMVGNQSGSRVDNGGTKDKTVRNVQIKNSANKITYSSWNGLENFMGNVQIFLDGFNLDNSHVYIAKDASKFQDEIYEERDGYLQSNSFAVGKSRYIQRMTYDTKLKVMVPAVDNLSGSATTYYCDYVYSDKSGPYSNCYTGADYGPYAGYGLFCARVYVAASNADDSLGSRLVYKGK